LKPELLQGLKDKLWKRPSPIQEYAIPLILEGHSLIARAKNGTGKTGAFLLPTLQLVDTKLAYTQALILVPNKELTLQICGIAH
jgi:ATP-dependent RNA helicase DDX6/DHH1